MEQGR